VAEGFLLAGCLLLGLAVGFWLGGQVGAAWGLRVGQAAAPLQLRREGLETGRCPLCGRGAPGLEGAPPGAPEPAGPAVGEALPPGLHPFPPERRIRPRCGEERGQVGSAGEGARWAELLFPPGELS